MRSEKELIQLCLDKYMLFDYYTCFGLCGYFSCLNIDFYINVQEKEFLLKILKENVPHHPYNKYYYFRPFNWQPRKEYLEQLLIKYTNEQAATNKKD